MKMQDFDSDEEEVEYEPETFAVGPFTVVLTTIAFMPIEKLARNQENGIEISGQKLWCGSLVVIEYLLYHSNVISGSTIIELGSGTGLLGMICRLLGASHVFLSDHDDRSITHMKQDLLSNNIDNCDVLQMDWNKFKEFDFSVFNKSEQLTIGQVAETPNKSIQSVRIMAGDVLYKKHLLEPFFNTIKVLFQFFPNSDLLLCHVPRNGNEHSHVLDAAASFKLQTVEIPSDQWDKGVVHKFSPSEDYTRAKLYRISNPQ